MKPAIEPTEPPTETPEATPLWTFNGRLTSGQWALALFALACLAGIAVIVFPEAAGLGGLAFLVGLTLCGAGLMFAISSGRLVPPEAR